MLNDSCVRTNNWLRRVNPALALRQAKGKSEIARAKILQKTNMHNYYPSKCLEKNSTFLMLDLLDLQNFAAQAQQLTKKLSSLPDPPVVRRGADLFG